MQSIRSLAVGVSLTALIYTLGGPGLVRADARTATIPPAPTLTDTAADGGAVAADSGAWLIHSSELTMYHLVNDERAARGIAELRFDTDLVDLARIRAADQVGALSHLDSDGQLAYARLLQGMGFRPLVAGEALVSVSGPVGDLAHFAHDTLLNSEHHRALLLDPRFTNLAVGGAAEPNQIVFAEIFSSR